MKRARTAAGWLKQKYKLLVLIAVFLTGCTTVFATNIPRAYAAATASWKDNKTIVYNGVEYSDKGNLTLAYNTLPGQRFHVYATSTQANGCQSEIYFNTDTDVSTAKTANLMVGQMGQGPSGSTGSCIGTTGATVTFEKTLGQANGDGDATSQVAKQDPCDASGDPLSWIICPVINMINGAIQWMQGVIDQLLEFDVTTVFKRNCGENCQTGDAYYSAWNSFRLVAIAVVVVAGLVMVISQAWGLDIFDAYTVKKVVPRLFVAAIGISLSWYLLEFLANITNDLGLAVRNMIYWPFSNLGNGDVGLNDPLSFLLGDVAVGAAAIALGIGGIFSLICTAGLAVLIAFLVLILRQIVLILLILLAPLAIALYVLPNTQKVYKLWWDSISKGFMMFPIITAFIATGRVFSVVAANAGGSGGHGTVNQIVSLIAFFLPYFALPFTFRLAGGAIATIGGLANDRSRGMFDSLKNSRRARMQDRFTRAQNKSLWDNNTKIGRIANTGATWATDPLNNVAATKVGQKTIGLRKRGRRIVSSIEHQTGEQSGKLFEELNKMGYNDRAYRAIAGLHEGMREETRERLQAAGLYKKAPQSIAELNKMAEILGQSSGATEQIAANAIRGSTGRLATLYQDQEMGRASVQAAGILGLSAHGFATTRDLAEGANSMKKSIGTAAAQSITNQAQLLGARSHPEVKNGYGVMYDSSTGEFVDGMVGNADRGGKIAARDIDLLKTLNSHDLAAAKGGAFDEIKPIIDKVFAQEDAATQQAVRDQMFSWAGPYSQASVDIKAKTLRYMQDHSSRAMRTVPVRDASGGIVRDAQGRTVTQQVEGWAEGSLMDRFTQYSRTETDPSVRGEGGPEPPDQNTGGGGANG